MYSKRGKASYAQAQAAVGIPINQQLYLPQMRGFWAHSNNNGGTPIYDLSGHGMTLTNGLIGAACALGHEDFMGYAAGDGTQGMGRADESNLDAATNWSAFTFCYFDNTASAQESVLAKWYTTGANQRSYILYRDASGNIVAGISGNGTDTYLATSTSTVGAAVWCYIGLSYTASTSVDVYLGASGAWETVSNTTSIPAAIHQGTGALLFFCNQTGAATVTNFTTGRISVSMIANSEWSEEIHRNNWQQYRQLLRV